jgi:dTDP-4-amino-4,6-dideoxygalactose transaminase
MNSRLDEIQAAILRVKLKALAQENKKRNALARIYHHEVRNEIFRMLQERSEAENVYHLFPVRTEKRNKFREFLKKNKIGSNIHYPVPIHRMPGYRGKFWLPYKGLPETEKAAGEVLSLPLYPEMSLQNAKKISTVANRFN